MNCKSKEKSVQHEFDSFCKKTLKYKAKDYFRKKKKNESREMLVDSILFEELENLLTTPDCYQEIQYFNICDEDINVTNEVLFEALSSLAENQRKIVLLSYYCGYTDGEIADQMQCVRRTVAHRRLTALKELKKIMEDGLNDDE